MYIKKFVRISFLILFTLVFLLLLLEGDVFAETQDSHSSPLIHTVGLELSSSSQPNNHDINTLTDTEGRRRVKGEMDSLQVFPGDNVDLIYFYEPLESIFLEKVRFMVSRGNPDLGNLSNILDMSNVDEYQVHTKWGNVHLYRDGMGIDYLLDMNIDAGMPDSFILETYEAIQPIQIKSWDIVPDFENQKVHMEVIVSNMTEEYLNNVSYEHCGYVLQRDFLPKEEYIFEYEIDKVFEEDEDIVLDKVHIEDPNTKTECSVYGNPFYQYFSTDAIPVYAYFNDSWFSGAYVQPRGDSFCIQRMPYSFDSEEIVHKYAVDNRVDKEEVEEGDVLGISENVLDKLKELPKTAITNIAGLFLLLVVDIYLWYSFFRKRRLYESKNKDTRIRTKSSKDVRKGRF